MNKEKRKRLFRCDRHKAIPNGLAETHVPLDKNKEAFPRGSDPSIGNASSFITQSALTSREMTTAMIVVTINTPAIRKNIVKSLLENEYCKIYSIPYLTMKCIKVSI